MILTFIVDVGDTLAKGTDYFASLGVQYLAAIVAFVTLFGVALATENARFHGAFALAACAYQLSWILRVFGTIS